MGVVRGPRGLAKEAIAAPIAPPPQITMRVPELIAATVYNLWKRASNLRERSPHTSVACPALVVSIRHFTCSLLRADGFSQALSSLRRGPRNHCDDPFDRLPRHRPGRGPRCARIGRENGLLRP